MLGLFKRMLSRSQPTPPAPVRPAVAPRAGAVPPPRPRSTSGPVRVTPVARPAATAAVRAAVAIAPAPALSAIPATPNGTHVYVSLGAIAASVPESISHKVPAQHDKFVAIPLEFIVPQLSQGQVVLTGAELIASSTEFFGALTPQDEVSVSLPLADVLQQVPKEYFVRKNKRKVEVPAEVGSVFAANGQGVSIARPPAAPVAPSAPAYRSQPAVTSTSAQPVPAPTPAAQKISISPLSLAAMKAATAAPTPVVTAPPAPRQAPPTPRAITPAPSAPPTSAPAPLPRVTAPAPAPVPMLKKVAPPAPKLTGELTVPLAAVSPDWDQEVRRQLSDIDQTQHQILVPLELLGPAMKSGKVLFSWAEVATWIQPPLPAPPTPKVGEMPVELVLKVIAPLFMQSQNAASTKRVAVDETIPDLFGGHAKEPQSGHVPSSAQIQTPLAPAPAPSPARAITPAPAPTPVVRTAPMPVVTPVAAPAPVAVPVVAPVAAPVAEEISADQVIGPEGSRFGAKEIVINTSRLPGVAGALLAMSDGLLVTSAAPASVKGETIAAFLPQMFGRMNQYTKELALGPLQQLTLGIESGQWHVVKGPNIYFAVLGKRGETLPLNLLAQVAAELSNQSK